MRIARILSASVWFMTLVTCHEAKSQSSLDAQLAHMLGTISTHFEPMLREGKLEGCTMVFSALVRDSKYELGEYLTLDGNVGLLMTEGGAGANLKLVVNRVRFASGQFQFEPSPPSRAYLVEEDLSTSQSANQKKIASDTLGGIFVVFDAVKGVEIFAQIATAGTIGVAFNQHNGKTDLLAHLDFRVIETSGDGSRSRANKTIEQFDQCIAATSANAKQ